MTAPWLTGCCRQQRGQKAHRSLQPGQVVLLKLRGRPVDAMQWLSLGLVVVMGGATLLTHDRHFIMVKPTIIYLAVGAVMLKPGWMNRYLPAIVQENAPDLGRLFGRSGRGVRPGRQGLGLVRGGDPAGVEDRPVPGAVRGHAPDGRGAPARFPGRGDGRRRLSADVQKVMTSN